MFSSGDSVFVFAIVDGSWQVIHATVDGVIKPDWICVTGDNGKHLIRSANEMAYDRQTAEKMLEDWKNGVL